MVVLDDSYSMQAKAGKQSFRDRAERELAEELRTKKYVARFILAGSESRMAGRPASGGRSARRCPCTVDLPKFDGRPADGDFACRRGGANARRGYSC